MSRKTWRLCWVVLVCASMGCEQPSAQVSAPATAALQAPSTTAPQAPATATLQTPSTAALQPSTLLLWDAEVGRTVGDESASEGPASFALVPDGGLLVLDQVNYRILHLDPTGHVANRIELPASTFEDVEQYGGRAVLALDRLVGKVLRVMNFRGELIREVPIEGSGIDNGGSITAMLTRPDGVWLEVDRRHSVRVLDRDLRPCARQFVFGRIPVNQSEEGSERDLRLCARQVILGQPYVNGQSLRVDLDGNGGVIVSIAGRTEREAARSTNIVGDDPIERVPWLESDARGHVYLALHEIRRATTSPYDIEDERYVVVELDRNLRELSWTPSPWVRTEYEQFVEFRLGHDGRLWQMAFTDDGALVVDLDRRQP